MSKGAIVATGLATWALALFVSLATYSFSDDHFGRISPARQITRYGELPFRDFFDPGYVLTELASAAVQWLFGDNLLGEMLLTSSFVAAGAVAILLLVRRATGSLWLGVATAVVAVLGSPRPYDFDKFFFYPFGLLVCWRYADTPSPRRLLAIAVAAVVAGMFRYDNGLFIAISGMATLAAVHSGDLALLVRRASLFMAACVACAAPYALFLQLTGGLINALDQMATYARREGARTSIGTLPPGVLSGFQVTRLPPPPPDQVQIRWTPDSDGTRAAKELRYSLHGRVQRGDPQDRTWLYEIDNATPANLRALVSDPHVGDTHMIDRAKMTLVPQETRWRRLWRRLPIVGTSSMSWSAAGAAAWVYYLFIAVSLVAVVGVYRSPAVDREGDRARVLSAALMTLLAVALVLRAPVVARIGGAIGPPAVLGAWMWRRFHGPRLARAGVATVVLATLAVATDWNWSLNRISDGGWNIGRALAAASVSPPPATGLPNPRLAGLVGYLRRCTRPADRVFLTWFQPDVYFFSQRGFAGGMVVVFGDHWSAVEYQRRIVDTLATQSVPLFILRNEDHAEFRSSYRVIDEYLRSQFQDAGRTSFGDADSNVYTVLTRRDRTPTGIDAMTSMPCFARSA